MSAQKSFPCRSSGFTIIELLVVISIIALLIAILLPALKSARETSQVTQTLSNLRQIQIAVHNYASDNRDYLPPRDGNPGTGSASLFPFWPARLVAGAYTLDPFIFWGPRRSTAWIGQATFASRATMRTSPLSANSYQYPGFAANQRVMASGVGAAPLASHRLGSKFAVNTASSNQKPGDSDILIMTEFSTTSFFGPNAVDGYWAGRHSGDSWQMPFTFRGAATSAFVDGHAVTTDSMTIGWRATDDRNGSWAPTSHNHWARQQPWFQLN